MNINIYKNDEQLKLYFKKGNIELILNYCIKIILWIVVFLILFY
jgi:hypothetical protein